MRRGWVVECGRQSISRVLLNVERISRVEDPGRACLIASLLSLVILNSISMANGSPDSGLYNPSKWSWITVRCWLNCVS